MAKQTFTKNGMVMGFLLLIRGIFKRLVGVSQKILIIRQAEMEPLGGRS
jgi:hypothetical protein